MQILGRMGSTISIKSSDLNFGLKLPRRIDLTFSSPPFLGASNNFYFMKNFDLRPPCHFSALGIKWAPLFGHPYKKFYPPMTAPIEKKGRHAKFGKDQSNSVAVYPGLTPKQTHKHTHKHDFSMVDGRKFTFTK